ncbi:hypothetical protein IMZ48_22015 [Candidatus Bathyarchaeota archaeon]|nr:hypothetical protein [Candidatus Bathyarchaeota archaeon]
MAHIPRVFRIEGTCNNYPWGKKGRDSLVARIAETSSKDFVIKEDEPYSEIWFGDFPDFPARVLATGELLKDTLNDNRPELLGLNVIQNMDGRLPFLPKVCLHVQDHERASADVLDSFYCQRTAFADPSEDGTGSGAALPRAEQVLRS